MPLHMPHLHISFIIILPLQPAHSLRHIVSQFLHIMHFAHPSDIFMCILQPLQSIAPFLSQALHMLHLVHISADFMSELQPVHFIIAPEPPGPDGEAEILLLSDDGNRVIDGVACKDLDGPARKRFRGLWVHGGW